VREKVATGHAITRKRRLEYYVPDSLQATCARKIASHERGGFFKAMARECGCRGGNENCTFCYGEGYVGKHYGRATQTGSPQLQSHVGVVKQSRTSPKTASQLARRVERLEPPSAPNVHQVNNTAAMRGLFATSTTSNPRSARVTAIGRAKGRRFAAGQGHNGPSEDYTDREGSETVENYWLEAASRRFAGLFPISRKW
jgi:hypothetical protein